MYCIQFKIGGPIRIILLIGDLLTGKRSSSSFYTQQKHDQSKHHTQRTSLNLFLILWNICCCFFVSFASSATRVVCVYSGYKYSQYHIHINIFQIGRNGERKLKKKTLVSKYKIIILLSVICLRIFKHFLFLNK